MKKSILTLAVIAGLASTAAYADGTTLYGTVKMRAEVRDYKSNNQDNKDGYGYKHGNSNGHTSTEISSDSEFGIKGSESLGGGLEAFYDINVNVKSGGDKAGLDGDKVFVGVRGGFGTVTLGTQDGVYEWAGDTVGGFNGTLDGTGVFFGPGDLSNSISYVSPSFGGFQFGLAAKFDGGGETTNPHTVTTSTYDAATNSYHYGQSYRLDKNGNKIWYTDSSLTASENHYESGANPGEYNEHVDGYQVALKYANYGFSTALAYHTDVINNGTDAENNEYLAFALGYENDKFSVDFGVEKYLDGSRFTYAKKAYTAKNNNGMGNRYNGRYGNHNLSANNTHRYDAVKAKAEPLAIGLAGKFNITDSDSVYAGISVLDHDANKVVHHDVDNTVLIDNKSRLAQDYDTIEKLDKTWEFGIGYEHKFSKRTKTWVEYVYVDGDGYGVQALQLGLSTSF